MTHHVVGGLNHAVAEPPLAPQPEIAAHTRRKHRYTAAQQDRIPQQLHHVHQVQPQRLGGQRRPPMDTSPQLAALTSATTCASSCRSNRVRRVYTCANVEENTTLSAACHVAANLADSGDCSAAAGSVSQTAIVLYVRRP
jgi:hypothetical protein